MPPAYMRPTNTPIICGGMPSAGAMAGASTAVAAPASEVKTWIVSVTASAAPATATFGGERFNRRPGRAAQGRRAIGPR